MLKYPTHALNQGGFRQVDLMPASRFPRRPKTKATGSFQETSYKARVLCVESIW